MDYGFESLYENKKNNSSLFSFIFSLEKSPDFREERIVKREKLREQKEKAAIATFLFGPPKGIRAPHEFVRYANRRILYPSRLRQGEPTRDGLRVRIPY